MRTIISTVTLSLAFALSCGDDNAPKRPEDGSVEVWGSCAWDGQVDSALCEPGLVCTTHGICSPKCMTADDCPTFDGFEIECSENQASLICRPLCNDAQECPKTGGAELHCQDLGVYCIGDP